MLFGALRNSVSNRPLLSAQTLNVHDFSVQGIFFLLHFSDALLPPTNRPIKRNCVPPPGNNTSHLPRSAWIPREGPGGRISLPLLVPHSTRSRVTRPLRSHFLNLEFRSYSREAFHIQIFGISRSGNFSVFFDFLIQPART